MSAKSGHGSAASSGGLAAGIAMAITQIVFLVIGQEPTVALTVGASLASIAFGLTYAGVFFVGLARRGSAGAGR